MQSQVQMDIHNVLSANTSQKSLRLIVELLLEQTKIKNKTTSFIMKITSAQNMFIRDTQNIQMKILNRFKYTPCMTIEINRSQLNELTDIRTVARIYPDNLSLPSLSQSVTLIGAKQSWEMGYSGQGQIIAIIDTGVDNTHPFLKGKVISEACFSSQSDGYNSQSVCPGGQGTTFGANSATPCSSKIKGYDHGTHVAGIVAGHNDQFSGVARDAQLMAIQVFSRFYDSPDNNDICNRMGNTSPCIMSFSSDQIQALEYVYDQKDQFKIAAVNMSLSGGTPYAKPCDSDPRSTIIDKLYAEGIAVVAAAGNNGYIKALTAPACISTVISVGATNNVDSIQSFTNSCGFLDFFAPGYAILSSVPSGRFLRMSGTSMASPIVAGALAIMRTKYPNDDMDQIVKTLKISGTMIKDVRNNYQIPRIQINNALSETPILLPEKNINSQVEHHQWRYYRIVTDTDECQYRLELHDLSNDADLYLRQLNKPTLTEWDFRPYKGYQQPETVNFDSTQASIWYVGVYGYRASTFELSLDLQRIRQLGEKDTYQDTLRQGEWHYYKLIPVLSYQDVSIYLDDIRGDMDLYCQQDNIPTLNLFQKRSNLNGQQSESIQIHQGINNNIYIGVYGYQQGGYKIGYSVK